MPEPRLVLVVSPFQNAFFAEIADVLAFELNAGGGSAVVTREPGEHVVEDHDVFVMMPPHEYSALEGTAWVDDAAAAARTIGLSAEQPHQPFFEKNKELGARLGAVVDFSPLAVAAYRDAGIDARHLAFGYTPHWDRFRPGAAAAGPPAVLYMGNPHPRRLGVLAGAADALARRGARLLISDNSTPNLGTGPAFVAGDDKRALLANTRLLINVHQNAAERYFEWLRFIEAAHCGAPMLTEVSIESAPYRAGVHFEEFTPDALAARLDAIIEDDALLMERREAAYEELRRHTLAQSIGVLVDVARGLLSARPPTALPPRTRTEPLWGTRPTPTPTLPHASIAAPVRRSLFVGRETRPPRCRIALLGEASAELLGTLREHDPGAVVLAPDTGRRALARLDAEAVLVVPAGATLLPGGLARLRAALDQPDAVTGAYPAMAVGVAAGRDSAGSPMLDGIWPWNAWHLTAGRHAGRVALVRGEVVRAAAEWIADHRMRGAAHVAVAAWIVAHGGVGAHVACPVAAVAGEPLDVHQRMSPERAELVSELIEG